MAHPYLSDEELKRLRAAKIPVPRSLKELTLLLKAAERDTRDIPLDAAFREIRARRRKRTGARRSA